MRKKLQFRVSSALKSIVGQDLITDDFVAVFELVKNSIDASASRIDLYFDLESDNPTISIVDNGKGMSFKDIEEKWLFLGYSAKRAGVEDKETKIYAGNKGVGRFSCDRLGGVLEIQARTKKCKVTHKIEANWNDFEKSSSDEFGKISISYEATKAFDLPKYIDEINNGVVIKISELRMPDSWDRQKLLKLKQSLAKLVSPFGGEKSSHKIGLHCQRELDKDQQAREKYSVDDANALIVNGVVENRIFDILNSKTTKLESYIKEGYLYSHLTDRGELIYKVREKLENEYEELHDANFEAQLYYLNHSAKTTFKRRMSVDSHNFGAVFLYRNGYQVVPVGEPEDDFWRLERRKGQGYNRYLSGRELMGRVQIYGHENKFKESSSRDKGLIDTPASLALRQLFMLLIRKFERYVAQISWKDKVDQNIETAERLTTKDRKEALTKLIADLSKSKQIEVLDYNQNLIEILNEKVGVYETSLQPLRSIAEAKGDKKLLRQVDKAEKALKKAKKEALAERIVAEVQSEAREIAEKNEFQSKKQLVVEQKRRLFAEFENSADQERMIRLHHQISLISGALVKRLKRVTSQYAKDSDKFAPEQLIEIIRAGVFEIGRIQNVAKLASKADFDLATNKVNEDLLQFIEEYINQFTDVSQGWRLDVKFINTLDISLVKSFRPIEVTIMVDNLLDNAGKSKSKNVVIEVTKENDHIMLKFIDDGIGLPIQYKAKDLFKKGISTTSGSGIGLNHVSKIASDLEAQITIKNNSEKGAVVTLNF